MFEILYCDCEKCSSMCHGPCCGTPEDIERLIESGYGNRLMYDDWALQPEMLKPALKNYEGETAPWKTSSLEGCTFWIDGKCELHDLGLKPSQGKWIDHNTTEEDQIKIADHIEESWQTEKAQEVIEKWKKINNQ